MSPGALENIHFQKSGGLQAMTLANPSQGKLPFDRLQRISKIVTYPVHLKGAVSFSYTCIWPLGLKTLFQG